MANGRCRFHGGLSTGAPGNVNALRHGRRTRAAEQERKSSARIKKGVRLAIANAMALGLGKMPVEAFAEASEMIWSDIRKAQKKNKAAHRQKVARVAAKALAAATAEATPSGAEPST